MKKPSALILYISFVTLLQTIPSNCLGQIKATHITDISSRYLPNEKHVETWLAVNPTDQNNQIAVAIAATEDANNYNYSVVYHTADGGRTWELAHHFSSDSFKFPNADPLVTFDHLGHAYFSTLHEGITVWKSNDKGRSWQEQSKIPGSRAFDRQWMIADSNRLYVYAKLPLNLFAPAIVGDRKFESADALALVRSNDYGETYRQPALYINDYTKELINTVNGFVITHPGSILAMFTAYGWLDETRVTRVGKIYCMRRTARSYTVHPIRQFVPGFGPGTKSKGSGVGGLAVSPVDALGKQDVYMTWDETFRGVRQVAIAHSSDDGVTWSAPLFVSDSKTGSSSVNSNVAVNKNGVVLLVWYDRRDDFGDVCYKLYGAVSTNGGITFSKNVLLDPELTCPCTIRSPLKKTDQCRFMAGGDTIGIVALPDGTFSIAYSSGKDLTLKHAVVAVQ